jgi:hypothetical protein
MTQIDYETLYTKLDNALLNHRSFTRALACVDQVARVAKRYSDAEVGVLLGESRAGKTRVLEIVEGKWPESRENGQAIMPILRIKISRKPTTKGVITQLLEKLGDPFYNSRGTETVKLLALMSYLKKLQVRVIMLDEFQHFVSERGDINFEIADLFKLIVDEAKVSLVLAGLPEARSVIDANEQLAGRSLNPVYLGRFNWMNDKSRAEFIQVVVGYANALAPLAFPDFNNEEWGFRWYCATGGLIGYVAKIFRTIVNFLAQSNRSSISLQDLELAHEYAVYTRSAPTIRPFSENFNPVVSAESLSHAKSVGMREEQEERPKRKRKPAKKVEEIAITA